MGTIFLGAYLDLYWDQRSFIQSRIVFGAYIVDPSF